MAVLTVVPARGALGDWAASRERRISSSVQEGVTAGVAFDAIGHFAVGLRLSGGC